MSAGAVPSFDPDKFMVNRGAGASFDPDAFMAKQQEATTRDNAVRTHLKDEGFLDSAWNVIKSPFSMISSLVSGEDSKSHAADMQRAKELEKNGTPEQRREFAKEYLLKTIPGASTAYKAAQGNIPGALGDVAGIATLGGIAKGADAAVDAAKIATNPEVARAALEVIPKGPAIGRLIDKVKAVRAAAAEAAPATEALTPGQVLAKQSGQDWSKLGADERGLLEQIAKGQQNAAAQPPRPPMGPPQAPPPEVAPQAPAAAPKTIAQQLAEDVAAEKAAAGEAPAPAPAVETPAPKGKRTPPARLPEGYQRVQTPVGTTGTPLGAMPDLSKMTRPQILEAAGLPPDATPAQIAQAVRNPPQAPQVQPPPEPAQVAPTVSTAPGQQVPAPPAPETPISRPSIDHGILSPNGKVSARSRAAAMERAGKELFGEEGLQRPAVEQPSQADVLRRQAQELRDLAGRGMKPRAYAAKAEELEQRAAEIEKANAVAAPPARMSLDQVEAGMVDDMLKGNEPYVDPKEARTHYDANGDLKSPQLRAAELTAANRAAKVTRIAQELHDAVKKQGGSAYEQLSRMTAPEMEKTLTAAAEMMGEQAPSDISRPQLMAELKRLDSAEYVKKMNERRGAKVGASQNQVANQPKSAIIPSEQQNAQAAVAVPGESPSSQGLPPDGANPSSPRPSSGSDTSILIPGEDRPLRARYEVRELSDVQPSHNGQTFSENPKYALKNERDYSKPENKQRVIKNSSEESFDPRYHITDNPDATNGPVVIDEAGNALGGNSRGMILQRVYARGQAGANAYRTMLQERAAQYGIDPAQVAGMKQPVLVRVVPNDELATVPGGAKWAIRKTNVSGTAQLSAAERSAADAGQLSPDSMNHIAGAIESAGPDATLTDALNGKSGTGIVNRLIDEGFFSEQERPALMDGKTGALTQLAKDRISKAMLGKFFRDSDQIARTPLAIKAKLERIAAPLSKVSGSEWDLTPKVQEAVDLIEYANAHGIKNLNDVVSQQGLFGNAPEWSPDAIKLAEILRDGNPNEVVRSFRKYVNDKEPTMFGESTPAEAFKEHFAKAGGK